MADTPRWNSAGRAPPSIVSLASPDLNIGPTGPQPLPQATRALTRVAPAAPRPVTDPEASNPSGVLDRSGLDLRELLAEPDLVVARVATPALATDVGIEQARGAFVRNQPAEALQLLDAVWEGAKRLETGWYLRGSSLALLGLPAETERLSKQALDTLPQSVALRFLQSVARLSLGDFAGARAALVEASGRRPADTLLQVHEALLVARMGDRDGAERLMRAAIAQAPDHPAIAWGRIVLRQAVREGARPFDEAASGPLAWLRTPSRSATPAGGARIDIAGDGQDAPSPWQRESAGLAGGAASAATGATAAPGDAITRAIRQLGAQLPTLSPGQAVAECRVLAAALTAGGAVGGAASGARAYTARTVIGAIMEALQPRDAAHGIGWDARSVDGQWQRAEAPTNDNPPVPDTLKAAARALVAALRDGRAADVDAILRRAHAAVDAPALALLHELAGSDRARTPAGGAAAFDAHVHASGANDATVRGGDTNAVLTALRLGLGLLRPGEATRSADGAALRAARASREVEALSGWAAAEAAGANVASGVYRGPSAGITATVIGIITFGAFYNAHPLVGIAGLAAVGWVLAKRAGARSRGRDPFGETRG